MNNKEYNLNNLINNIPDFIFSIDLKFRLTLSNNAFDNWTKKVLGEKLEIGEHLLNPKFGLELIFLWKTHFQKVFKGDSFTLFEEFNHEGDTEYFEAQLIPLFKENIIVGASCISRNVTEQKRNFDIIQSQNKKLREIAWLQSHKVRSHISRILGLKPLFNKEDILDPDNIRILNYIEEEMEYLDKVISEINAKTIFINK